jgi:calcineurin-like phosphoesterase family protein
MYVISDNHFDHANVIKYAKRPYADVHEMNADMIKKWNEVVSKKSEVLYLGDFCLGFADAPRKYTTALNGTKVLIKGNHDNRTKSFYLRNGFNSVIKDGMFMEINSQAYLFTHRPVKPEVLGSKIINVHGHVHEYSLADSRYINVSGDVLGYKPVHISKLKELAASKKYKETMVIDVTQYFKASTNKKTIGK